MNRWIAIVCAIVSTAGCAAHQPAVARPATNAPIAMSVPDARAALDATVHDRKPLARPLVICGGFLDVGIGPWLMRRTLARSLDGPIVDVSFATCFSLESCRRRLVRHVDAELGKGDDAAQTVEVDVIGQSLGGLIAMHAALDDPKLGRRVRIRRLYTICSPLQGATLAEIVRFDVFDMQRDLRPGSAMGARLARTPLDYELTSYARTRDKTVGEHHTGLPGRPPIWVDTPPDEDAHDGADFDPRILLDVTRRLRGETSIAATRPAPLPR